MRPLWLALVGGLTGDGGDTVFAIGIFVFVAAIVRMTVRRSAGAQASEPTSLAA
jgi:uncharacterized membrane protein